MDGAGGAAASIRIDGGFDDVETFLTGTGSDTITGSIGRWSSLLASARFFLFGYNPT